MSDEGSGLILAVLITKFIRAENGRHMRKSCGAWIWEMKKCGEYKSPAQ
jgi:hypothetical protein